jgi:hypothetical protein
MVKKCREQECPLRHSCFRFKVPDGFRQEYLPIVPYIGESGCSYYWDIKLLKDPVETERLYEK